MGVIDTRKWLVAFSDSQQQRKRQSLFYEQQTQIIRPLQKYFPAAAEHELQQFLLKTGLFQYNEPLAPILKAWDSSKLFSQLHKQYSSVRSEWNGPEVPVIALPSDSKSRELQVAFNGKTGLAFPDKLLLLLPKQITAKELQALVIHEYHHVCRISQQRVSNEKLTLLDTIITEGAAERAVYEKLGPEYQAIWTKRYSLRESTTYYQRYLKGRLTLSRNSSKHDYFLYGSGLLPKWLGYNVGYHIVESAATKQDWSAKDLLKVSAADVLESSSFAAY